MRKPADRYATSHDQDSDSNRRRRPGTAASVRASENSSLLLQNTAVYEEALRNDRLTYAYAHASKNKRLKLSAADLIAFVMIEPIARELLDENGGWGKAPRLLPPGSKRGADGDGNGRPGKAPRKRGADEVGSGRPGKTPRERGAGLGRGATVRIRVGKTQKAYEDGKVLDPG